MLEPNAHVAMLYDNHVAECGNDAPKLSDSLEAVTDQYLAELAVGEAPLIEFDQREFLRLKFRERLVSVRRTRKEKFADILDAFAAALDGVYGEIPIGLSLAHAMPLGTSDGRDKQLAYWTVADYQFAASKRHEKAIEAQEQAEKFDTAAQRLIDRMVARGVTTTGQLFAAVKV